MTKLKAILKPKKSSIKIQVPQNLLNGFSSAINFGILNVFLSTSLIDFLFIEPESFSVRAETIFITVAIFPSTHIKKISNEFSTFYNLISNIWRPPTICPKMFYLWRDIEM
jgi:hypothetical protein